MTEIQAPQPAHQAEPDHDAWKCDRCHGEGWHWVEREGVEWRDKVHSKEHCEQCDGLGFLGPDAAKAAEAELDKVLAEYRDASDHFDAEVLARFIKAYPKHAAALRRYSTVQLTFVQPTREEIEAEEVPAPDPAQAVPAKLQGYIETRDRRCASASGWNRAPITEHFTRLMRGETVRVGGRSSCGSKVDPSWVEFTAWNEVVRKARTLGIRIKETPVKHGNGWATKARGFWDENDYALDATGAKA